MDIISRTPNSAKVQVYPGVTATCRIANQKVCVTAIVGTTSLPREKKEEICTLVLSSKESSSKDEDFAFLEQDARVFEALNMQRQRHGDPDD